VRRRAWLAARADELRRTQTPAERHFGRLLARHMPGRWRAQHPVHLPLLVSAVLDFYCPAARLAVEIDGPSHLAPAARRRDRRRDLALRLLRIRTIRITNTDARAADMHFLAWLYDVMEQRIGSERS
jgi:very-short-patch-repair endonuclease